MAWSGLLSLADLGFGIFVGNRLQKALGVGDKVGFQRQVGTAAFIYALMALLMVAIAALLAVLESASPFVSIRSLNSSEASLVLFSLGVMQAVTTTKSAFTQIYRAYGEYSRGVIIDSVSSLCIVVAALAAALGGAGPRVLALTYILAQLVFAWGILLTDLKRRYPKLRLWPLPPSVLELRDAGLAMRWYALTYAAPTMWLQAPVLLLSALGLGGPVVVTFVLHRTLVNFGRNIVVMLSTSAGVELDASRALRKYRDDRARYNLLGKERRGDRRRDGGRSADLRRLDYSIMDRKIGFVRYGRRCFGSSFRLLSWRRPYPWSISRISRIYRSNRRSPRSRKQWLRSPSRLRSPPALEPLELRSRWPPAKL